MRVPPEPPRGIRALLFLEYPRLDLMRLSIENHHLKHVFRSLYFDLPRPVGILQGLQVFRLPYDSFVQLRKGSSALPVDTEFTRQDTCGIDWEWRSREYYPAVFHPETGPKGILINAID